MDIAVKSKNRKTGWLSSLRRRPLLPFLLGLTLLGIGVAAGMSFSRSGDPGGLNTLALSVDQNDDWIDDICSNYRIFGKSFQPMTDVGPEDEGAVAELVRRMTGLEMTVPSFEGTTQIFEGARIVAINRLPGVELFYRNTSGDLLSVFILARPVSEEHQLSEVQETIRDNLTVAWWQGERALFALVGPSSEADMPELAQAAYLKL